MIKLDYKYEIISEAKIKEISRTLPIQVAFDASDAIEEIKPNSQVIEKTSQFRIAKLKDKAVSLADQGNFAEAVSSLKDIIADLRKKALDEFFEIAEEISQLEHYAERLENHNFDRTIRKEMRDQSYQSLMRDRADLKFRGTTAGDASRLEAITEVTGGVLLRCEKIGGKLRMKVISEGYDSNLNVQFPRSIREAGITYIVDEIQLASNGTFYRTVGKIRRLIVPGQEPALTRSSAKKPQKLQSIKAAGSWQDLETTDTVGDGVIIQCVPEGKKLRARVVSDGYNPDYNVRFPRDIRAEGILYVVDDVQETAQGGSYIAYGKVRRLVQ